MEVETYVFHMDKKRKIATNIPERLLREATELTGLNQTQTLIAGLRELIAERKRSRLLGLRGRISIGLDVDRVRQRRAL
jgi:hypothetical protein